MDTRWYTVHVGKRNGPGGAPQHPEARTTESQRRSRDRGKFSAFRARRVAGVGRVLPARGRGVPPLRPGRASGPASIAPGAASPQAASARAPAPRWSTTGAPTGASTTSGAFRGIRSSTRTGPASLVLLGEDGRLVWPPTTVPARAKRKRYTTPCRSACSGSGTGRTPTRSSMGRVFSSGSITS